ncbi:MAG: acyl carrier protein [Deltaproteobacteria bacterium]|nr:acyl carrier protein [Deltaproteobacteria bacterium]
MSAELTAYFQARDRTLTQVIDLLIRDLKVLRAPDEIDPDTPLFGTGLGLDSIDAVELLVAFEKEFGIKLDARGPVVTKLRSVNALVDAALNDRGSR